MLVDYNASLTSDELKKCHNKNNKAKVKIDLGIPVSGRYFMIIPTVCHMDKCGFKVTTKLVKLNLLTPEAVAWLDKPGK
jgi:hypothetical protein